MDIQLFDTPLSTFWNFWVMSIISIEVILVVILVIWTQKIPAGSAKKASDTTGHEFDGITEFNNPLPRWWLYLLYIAVIFTVVYLILYPGFGNNKGILNWTQESQLQEEKVANEKVLKPIYARFSEMSIKDMSKDKQAQDMGRHLFLSFCSVCHGSNAKGTVDFPNLTDKDWLYGGEPEQIQTTILNGRGGVMPAFGGIPLNDEQLNNLANYVVSLSGRKHDQVAAEKGKQHFMVCSACHGADGSGNQIIGSANLTDNIWLHGRHISTIKANIKSGFDGKKNRMPAFKAFLGKEKIKILASYIYGLSN